MMADRDSLKLVLLGPPAAGKGTQADLLCRKLGIPHVSTGAIIRKEILSGSELGRSAEAQISGGQLLSDETVCRMVKSWLGERANGGGFIFDGFPRTVPQAESLDSMLERMGASLDAVLLFNVSREIIEKRILGRLQCDSCGAVYNMMRDGVTEGDLCQEDRGVLKRRADDTLEALEHRIVEYEEKTMPLEEHYRGRGLLVEIDGAQPPSDVFAFIMETLATAA